MIELIWRALGTSAVYRAFGILTGAERFQRWIVSEYIKPQPGQRVLDIGCGPGDWLRLLPGVDYTGVDYNPEYIAAARERYKERGKFEVAPVGPELQNRYRDFDIVLAMGVLHHLTDEEAEDLLKIAASAVRDDGRFVTLDGAITATQGALARKMVLRDRGRFMREPSGYRDLATPWFGTIEDRVLSRQLRIPYTHYVMVAKGPRRDGR